MALVDENGADCTAAVIGPGCVGRRVRVSVHARATLGRAGVSDMGMRKTFARDARAGDRERIVKVYGGCETRKMLWRFRVNNSLKAESSPPCDSRALNVPRPQCFECHQFYAQKFRT